MSDTKHTQTASEKELLEQLQKIIANNQVFVSDKPAKSSAKDYIIIAVLVLLVVISGVQTAKLSTLQVKGVKASQDTTNGSSSQQLPSNLQNLPNQVGGC